MKTLPRLVLITASLLLLGAVPMTTPATFSMNFFGFTSSATSADGTWSSNGGISEVGGFTMSWTLSGGQLAHLNATLVGKQGAITFGGALRRRTDRVIPRGEMPPEKPANRSVSALISDDVLGAPSSSR